MTVQFDRNSHVFHSPEFIKVVDKALEFFINSPVHPLSPLEPFKGAGVYSLYYKGNFQHYSSISRSNQKSADQPIYAGKAVPPGWRQGRLITANSPSLFSRL